MPIATRIFDSYREPVAPEDPVARLGESPAAAWFQALFHGQDSASRARVFQAMLSGGMYAPLSAPYTHGDFFPFMTRGEGDAHVAAHPSRWVVRLSGSMPGKFVIVYRKPDGTTLRKLFTLSLAAPVAGGDHRVINVGPHNPTFPTFGALVAQVEAQIGHGDPKPL